MRKAAPFVPLDCRVNWEIKLTTKEAWDVVRVVKLLLNRVVCGAILWVALLDSGVGSYVETTNYLFNSVFEYLSTLITFFEGF